MVKQPESRLKCRIKQALQREVGGKWIAIHGGPFQEAGLPDLIGCVEGFFIAIEIKIGRKRPTPLQQEQINDIKSKGGIAICVNSVESALKIITMKLNGKFSDTQIYKTWLNIKTRCYNKNTPCYRKYGRKGVRVCDEWLKGVFFLWRDMGPIPQVEDGFGGLVKYSIDRIDSNGNYEPSNCQWLPLSDNSGKNSRNCLITYRGKTQTKSAWAREYGLHVNTLCKRLDKGLSFHKAITTLPDQRYIRGK